MLATFPSCPIMVSPDTKKYRKGVSQNAYPPSTIRPLEYLSVIAEVEDKVQNHRHQRDKVCRFIPFVLNRNCAIICTRWKWISTFGPTFWGLGLHTVNVVSQSGEFVFELLWQYASAASLTKIKEAAIIVIGGYWPLFILRGQWQCSFTNLERKRINPRADITILWLSHYSLFWSFLSTLESASAFTHLK